MEGKRGAAGLRRGAGGHYEVFDPDPPKGQPKLFERETYTCAHCGSLHTVPPLGTQAETPGRCFQCDKLICQECLKGGCTPFEKKIEEMEARGRLFSALGI